MKKSFIFIGLFFAFIVLNGCKSDQTTSPQLNSNTGAVLLKIDRENAPANVVTVAAILSRSGFSTLTSNLNLLSDSTAGITFTGLAIGSWHLKVDAKDNSGNILYTGQTDVNIIADQTAQVNLTLQATGSGTGSIQITVNWPGTNSSTGWIDYINNPVLTPQNFPSDYLGVSQSKVLVEDGLYKMWFCSVTNSARKYVEYAISQNGISWTRPVTNPVLVPGDSSSWDALAVHPGAIIKIDGVYWMYYNGFANANGSWHIGLATSTDGINWQKRTSPVLLAGTGWEYQIYATSVIQIDNLFYMYYTGKVAVQTV